MAESNRSGPPDKRSEERSEERSETRSERRGASDQTTQAEPETKDSTAARQRRIQQEQDERDHAAARAAGSKQGEGRSKQDAKREDAKKEDAKKQHQQAPGVQAGAVRQPDTMPAQHVAKPGAEHELELRPRFLAEQYKGSGKLDGFATLITGGDSGIGRAVAVLFAREGADVAIVYHVSSEDAQETKRHVEKEGRRCLLIQGDVTSSAFCDDAVARTLKEFGRLDVLVNNAAFQEHAKSIEDITDERLTETLRTNIQGYFAMARAAVPHLKAGGSIINTGSVTGLEGSAHLLDYAATKGAIHAFTKSLAQNLIGKGIRVNAVAPGPVWTPLNPADAPAEQVAAFGKSTDMKRAAQPEELSPAYVFLAAPVCAGYITGVVLPVTGSVGAI